MRNIFIVLFLLMLTAFWKMGHLGYALYTQTQQWDAEGTSLAKQYTAIVTTDKISLYNGKESYVVVQGKTAQNIPMIAWFQNEKLVASENQKDITTEDTIKKSVLKQVPQAQKIRVIPGMENKAPIWEVTFTDQDAKLNYYYYHMKNGSFIRSYRLQKVDD
jgi:uncharacterized protein YpmB